MKTLQITLNELANYELAPQLSGFGMCGYNYIDGGYIYASEGHGNLESYITLEELLNILDEDGMQTGVIDIEVNENNEITYVHMDVWPTNEKLANLRGKLACAVHYSDAAELRELLSGGASCME